MNLERDYSIAEVAEAIGMSDKWIRQRIKDGAEHLRYGHKIRFTSAQVEKLRAAHTQAPAVESITTGRKRRAS